MSAGEASADSRYGTTALGLEGLCLTPGAEESQ